MIYLKHKETSGRLPTSEYELFDENVIVGKIQIRHKPSCGVGIPKNMASHIYYEIFPEYRLKGYGKKILTLGLQEIKNIGLKEVYITCMENNIGSKKIIEANGAVFIENTLIPEDNKKMFKYRIIFNDL